MMQPQSTLFRGPNEHVGPLKKDQCALTPKTCPLRKALHRGEGAAPSLRAPPCLTRKANGADGSQRRACVHSRALAPARGAALQVVDPRPADRADRPGPASGAVPAALFLVPPVDRLPRLLVGS